MIMILALAILLAPTTLQGAPPVQQEEPPAAISALARALAGGVRTDADFDRLAEALIELSWSLVKSGFSSAELVTLEPVQLQFERELNSSPAHVSSEGNIVV